MWSYPNNLRVHKAAGLAELVEARGVRLLYLPPRLPDLNPIELALSKLKAWLHTAQAHQRRLGRGPAKSCRSDHPIGRRKLV